MIVYIVTRGFDDEGEDILNVFNTKEKAEKYLEKIKQEQSPSTVWGDYFNIYEFEVQ